MLFTSNTSQPPWQLQALLHDHHMTLVPALPAASILVTGSVSGSGDVYTTASGCNVKVRWHSCFTASCSCLAHPNSPCKVQLAGITLPRCSFTSLLCPPDRL